MAERDMADQVGSGECHSSVQAADALGGEMALEFTPFVVSDEMVPQRCSKVEVRESTEDEGTHLAYEPASDGLFLMNPTGKLIFELCSGDRTVAQIVDCLRSRYIIPDSVDLRERVGSYLAILRSRRMITL